MIMATVFQKPLIFEKKNMGTDRVIARDTGIEKTFQCVTGVQYQNDKSRSKTFDGQCCYRKMMGIRRTAKVIISLTNVSKQSLRILVIAQDVMS